jgi:hypothetical protein
MLRQKLARLSSEFATQVFLALRAASLEDLTALARPMAAQPFVATVPRIAKPRVAKNTTARVAPTPDRELTRAAVDFFAARGAKGATAVQLQDHLQAEGASDVFTSLAARGVIRDAGIRRATGKGTAPVYVLSVSA